MAIRAVVFDAYGTLYNVQSVAQATEELYPGYGEVITQIWRLKQLEYTWLRSLMQEYEDFASVTRASLRYTLKLLGLSFDQTSFERIVSQYTRLALYPEAADALAALPDVDLAILSNGSPDLLQSLVHNSGVAHLLKATISVDEARIYKPSPDAYRLIEARLGVPPSEVLFVSSNPFDVSGAMAFGLRVAWVERVRPETIAANFRDADLIKPLAMFQALRQQMDELGYEPDFRIPSLTALRDLI